MLSSELQFDFLAPRQIVFGWGRRSEVGRLGRSLGGRAFLLCGSRTLAAQGAVDGIVDLLRAEGIKPVVLETLSHEPEVADVDRVAAVLADEQQAGRDDFVLAIGGGAVIDLAKAVAAMATNRTSPTIQDYLEGVGRGLTIDKPPLPVLAMPTTAGTGTEATKNAVISSYDPPFKKSIRDERLVPQIALVDPELTVSVPPDVTAASGMDAITQLIESFVSKKRQPIPRALAKDGLRRAIPAIREAVHHAESCEARENMAYAAMLSGMCLANAGLGFAHGVAPALGVHCRVPHGAACALLLPVALRVNREVCETDFAELAHAVFGKGPSVSRKDAVAHFIDEIDQLCDDVGVPRRLSQVGVRREQIPDYRQGLAREQYERQPAGGARRRADSHPGGAVVILSAGLTPAWQQALVFDRFNVGEVNRASEVAWSASGKVFNAAIGVHSLGGPSRVLATVGGPALPSIEADFARLGIPHRWI